MRAFWSTRRTAMLTLEELLSLIGHDRWQDIVLSAGNVFFCLEPVLDGEAVVCGHVADFEKLHSREHNDRAFLYAFEPLVIREFDCRPLPLHARKA
jgi:ATP-dependent DNA ligase